MPWLKDAMLPGGVPDSDLWCGLVSTAIFISVWTVGLVNLIQDCDRNYSSWKCSLATLVYALGIVFPCYLAVMAINSLLR